MRERRLLIVAPTASPGGAERALVELVRHLPDHGWRVHVVCLADGDLVRWLREIGVTVDVVSAGRLREPHRYAWTVLHLAWTARRFRADVFLGSMNKGHLYAGAAAVLARRPAVWWQHGIPAGGRFERAAAKVPAAAVVAGSSAAVAAQEALTPDVDVHLVPPGTPVAAWAARRGAGLDIRAGLGWQDCLVFGVPGRLHVEKDQLAFLQAAVVVAAACSTARFLVVGGQILGWEGDYEKQLRAFAECHLPELVHFTRHQDDVAPWIDAMDVVVVPSRTESFGLVLVEALAMGKPVVATDCGGPRDILVGTGRLVPPRDLAALARTLVNLTDADRRSEASRGADERAGDYSSQTTTAAFAAVVATLGARER